MKRILLHLIAAVAFLPSVVVAQSAPLKCTVHLTQGSMLNTKVLAPRTKFGRQFARFSLDLEKDPQEAWQHQNMCVTKRDFQGASFDGTLCVVVGTGQESADVTAPGSLFVDVLRDVVRTGSAAGTMRLPGVRKESLGGVNVVIPFNRDGRRFMYNQSFANKGTKGELSGLVIECGAS